MVAILVILTVVGFLTLDYLWFRRRGLKVIDPLELPNEEDRLLPTVLTAADGTILVPVQKYDASEAALLLFKLDRPAAPPPAGEVAYNELDPSEDGDPD